MHTVITINSILQKITEQCNLMLQSIHKDNEEIGKGVELVSNSGELFNQIFEAITSLTK
ncbi:hypothetical protein [Fictibacillus sp. KU28468]|uniref:hypothetical protein n=1 Tax=Fictibacillus sp. KU28468 TaxID=2991053 RepID=UPI00223D0949|nr:hypothetical protein [Fictibacillus sp. KU28468]UZJ80018.1 hypothetical protein OKX00_05980 [Fictibacillus sp. KU28468]